MTAEENDIDCLFELCKEDFPFLSSEQQTINIGKFLQVSQIWKYQKIVRDDYFEKEISVENNDIHFASDTRNTDENNKDYYISISGLFDNNDDSEYHMGIRMIFKCKILDMNNRYHCESDKKITDRNNKDL